MELPETRIPGLVWAHFFARETGTCQRVPPVSTIQELFAQDGFVWLHLGLSDARVPALISGLPGITPDAYQALISRDAHASLSASREMICGTLVDFQRDFDEMSSEIGWLHFAVTDKLIVTTRLHPLRSIDQARAAIEKSGRISSPFDVLGALVAECQRTVVTLVHEINEELNLIEDYVYEDAEKDETRKLAPARRTIVKLHRHLRTELALLRRVTTADEDEIPDGFDTIARQLSDRIETVERDVFSLQERARLLHEDIDSKATRQTNRHLYILSLLTAFLMPPTLVTGFFGMNTENLPLADTDHGTLFAAIIIMASIGLAWWLLRRFKIL
ncbi:MAG: magnesium transporter CorA-like protein [Rhizobium sp.]|nr:magnesium transporter CorA-like protein [Rhizobium sp.]